MHALFIDKVYSSELMENLAGYRFAEARKGTYEELSADLKVHNNQRTNLFLYIDPFGIKSLDLSLFHEVVSLNSTVEFLLNFNSFGFFRNACKAYGVDYSDVEPFTEVEEREIEDDDTPNETIEKLNRVAGGIYWQDIVQEYRAERINGYSAEQILSEKMCIQLRKSYQYVLNVPVRIKKGNRPKYRMVFGSNHVDGCLLMYDNMQKRMEQMHLIQEKGQSNLFDLDSEDSYIDPCEVETLLMDAIRSCTDWLPIKELLARYVISTGITLPLTRLYNFMRSFEKRGLIDVMREPQTTNNDMPSNFMQPGKGKKVYIRCSNA